MQHVAPVSVRFALPLCGGQDVGAGQMHAQLVGDELSGSLPVGVLLGGGADARSRGLLDIGYEPGLITVICPLPAY